MLPSTHIATGVLLLIALQLAGVDPLFAVLAVIGAVLPDWDFVLYRGAHRDKTTHAPLLWFLALTPLAFAFPPFIFLEIGVFVHLILDTIDWGIMWLHPKSSRLYGGIMRKKNIRKDWNRRYLSHNGMVTLELFFLVAALLSSYFVLL